VKKKNAKRLSLHRETLATLIEDRLRQADGGASMTCPKVCCSTCTASYSCPPPPTGAGETCLC
jgi:hypothetical protein